MGRRIRWLGIVLIVLFGVVLFQLGNIQFHKAGALCERPKNPRNASLKFDNQRGQILASTAPCSPVVPATSGSYKYQRVYPQGSLYSQLVGYDSSIYGTTASRTSTTTTWSPTPSPPVLAQLLSPPPKTTDDVTLTINPTLQKTAQEALHRLGRQQGRCDRGTRPADRGGARHVLEPDVRPEPTRISFVHDPDRGEARLPRQGRRRFLTLVAHRHAAIFPRARRSRSSPPPRSTTSNRSSRTSRHRCSPARRCPSPTRSSVTTAIPCGGRSNRCCRHRVTPATPCSASRSARNRSTSRPSPSATTRFRPRHPRRCRLALPSVTDLDPANQGLPGVAYSAIGQQDVAASALQNALVAAGIANHGR